MTYFWNDKALTAQSEGPGFAITLSISFNSDKPFGCSSTPLSMGRCMASSTIQLELSAGWGTRFGLRQARCLLTSDLLARSQHLSVIAGIQAGSVGKFNPVCHSFQEKLATSGHVNVTYRLTDHHQRPSQTVASAVRSLTSSRAVLLPGVRGSSVSFSRFAIQVSASFGIRLK